LRIEPNPVRRVNARGNDVQPAVLIKIAECNIVALVNAELLEIMRVEPSLADFLIGTAVGWLSWSVSRADAVKEFANDCS
jgi:hypothetical protein